ncbi:aromatic ring-hydroxylating dioxygenase subunit alpha [Sphingobium phenoxybenzoativorans]|uniref:Aromatic ring-hydroxylating dioxygenase subunit alpha n=1 Tax=Sphingobium phenoxybenzoativorans TaxID=1592790 RepID=A0A975K6V6_9SPHN|nr:aromatic ring-hydroxylating dioxygenase subunit alpha [Sphingobium phenoxybenzoativorans]QUT05582.1 aromatic ring-hydroxylating dioxygenase subunit alpha [Sphingobium phenoxybenzoativorans]
MIDEKVDSDFDTADFGRPGIFRSLVDVKQGEINRRIYSSPEVYKIEQQRIFSRAWLYVGHESQVPNPGDFILSKMGEESVIVARGNDHKVSVMLNSCRHRGMKVCRYDEGNTKRFYCPYHAWTYGLDGRLIGVQDYRETYVPPFDRGEWGLVRARTASIRGAIWATWDDGAPDFDVYLGEAKDVMESAFRPVDGGDGEIEVLGGVQRWRVNCNWKIIAENGSGDVLHAISHASVDMAGINPSEGEGRRDDAGQFVLSTHPEGHGFIYTKWPVGKERVEFRRDPVVSAWFTEKWRLRNERLGSNAGVWPLLGTIFPNMSFHCQQPRSILVSHPIGPEQTEMWRVYFVEKDAPEEVKQFLKRYYLSYSGPAGMTEQDDMENWQYATNGSLGTIARRYPFHYKAGMGQEGRDDQIAGTVTEHPIGSEQNPRSLYSKWAELMDSSDWDELLDRRKAGE